MFPKIEPEDIKKGDVLIVDEFMVGRNIGQVNCVDGDSFWIEKFQGSDEKYTKDCLNKMDIYKIK